MEEKYENVIPEYKNVLKSSLSTLEEISKSVFHYLTYSALTSIHLYHNKPATLLDLREKKESKNYLLISLLIIDRVCAIKRRLKFPYRNVELC